MSDIDEDVWQKTFCGFVPFASLEDPKGAEMLDEAGDGEELEDYEPVDRILVVLATCSDCPVLLLESDWGLYPIAASLDDFVSGTASGRDLQLDDAQREQLEASSVSLCSPFEEFEWIRAG
jgi:hypothetical protein